MASIKGIKILDLRTFRGKKYPVNFQGIIYYNKSTLGFWTQDVLGGSDFFDFNTKTLNQIANEYYGNENRFNLDRLLSELVVLNLYERKFSNILKEGYVSILVLKDDYEELIIPSHTKDKEQVLSNNKEKIEKFNYQSVSKVKMFLFTDYKDFDL